MVSLWSHVGGDGSLQDNQGAEPNIDYGLGLAEIRRGDWKLWSESKSARVCENGECKQSDQYREAAGDVNF